MSNQNQIRGPIGSGKGSAKSEKDQLQDVLAVLLREEDNKYCADCEAKSPRWASWNIGVFICIRCAGIHRKLGVHISRVKSVNLDSWTLEQVACVATIGNTLARAAYEANLPNGFRRPNSDAGMEQFIKAKYEERRYLIADFMPPKPDTSAVLALMKAPGPGSQQQQLPVQQPVQQSRLVLPRPLPGPNSASAPTSQPTAQLPTSQLQKPSVESQPQPQQKQQQQPDLLLIGVEESPVVAGATSPDSDFGSFIAPPTSTGGRAPPQQQQQVVVLNPDLIFDDTATAAAGGWPSVGVEVPKKSAKDSIMALYGGGGQQQQHQQPPFFQQQPHQQPHYQPPQHPLLPGGNGMHYSASSPMLISGQQQQYPGYYIPQQQQQLPMHPGLYSQAAGALIYSGSSGVQQQPFYPAYPQQQQQHTAAAPGGNQTAYLHQIQSQMANMGLSANSAVPATQALRQQPSAVNDFPADIWK